MFNLRQLLQALFYLYLVVHIIKLLLVDLFLIDHIIKDELKVIPPLILFIASKYLIRQYLDK